MFKFFANATRPKKYLIISILGLMLLSAGLGVAFDIKSRNTANKQPSTAPSETVAVAETTTAKTEEPPVQNTTKAATAKKSAAKTKTPPYSTVVTGDHCRLMTGENICPAEGRFVLSRSTFTLEVGGTINEAVTIRTEVGMPTQPPMFYVSGARSLPTFFIYPNPQNQIRSSWTLGIRALTDARPGTYQMEVRAMGEAGKDFTRYKAMVTVTIIEKPYFEITATRIDDKTEVGYFAVRINYSRIGNYNNALPEPDITMQPDEESCELFEDGADQYVFECDIEQPSPSYSITFSVTDYLGVTKSTNITISWP